MSSANKQKMTWRHITFAIAMGAAMGIGVGMLFNAAGVFYPHVATEFGFIDPSTNKPNTGPVGLWLTIVFIGTAIILPFCGRLLEKYSARILYTVAMVCLVAAFGINAAAPGIWAFYVAGVIATVPSAFILYLTPVLVARWFTEKLGFVTGLISSMSGIGAAVWNIMAASMIAASGWRMGYVLYALCNLIVCLPLVWLFVRSKPEDVGVMPYGYSAEEVADEAAIAREAEERRLATKGASYKDVIKHPAFYLFAVQGFAGGVFAGINQFIPTYANYTLAGDPAAIALIGASMTSATMISNLLGKVIFATVTDKSPLAAVLLGAGVPAIALVLLLTVASADSPAMFFIACGFIYGFCNPNAVLILPLCVRKAYGDKDYSKIWGMISPVAALAAGVGFSIWGFIAAASSFEVVFTIGLGVLVVLVVCYLGARATVPSLKQTTIAEDEAAAAATQVAAA